MGLTTFKNQLKKAFKKKLFLFQLQGVLQSLGIYMFMIYSYSIYP